MDTIFIRGLTVDAFVGVYTWEKDQRQPLVFDIEMACDISNAAANDDIRLALDYHAVCQRVEKFVEINRFELVETFAEKIAKLIMDEFAVAGIRLRVAKPDALANTIDVGVAISRGVAF